MNDTHIKTLAQVHAFLEGTHTVTFSLQTKTERYEFSCMARSPGQPPRSSVSEHGNGLGLPSTNVLAGISVAHLYQPETRQSLSTLSPYLWQDPRQGIRHC